MDKEAKIKMNYTKKEQAIKEIEEEQRERESINAYNNIMSELNIEVTR
jgi:hypothetical protein